jgi:hypothetical protein
MQTAEAAESASGWRFRLGIATFVLAFAIWLLVPLAGLMHVPASAVAALTGTLFICNKALLLLVVAIMGKQGLGQLKRRVVSFAAALVPAEPVGPLRHRIGNAMFCLPLISSFIEPYVDAIAPNLRPDSWAPQIIGDVMLIASFFVLGGNFWEKARALFVRTARVIDTPAETAS